MSSMMRHLRGRRLVALLACGAALLLVAGCESDSVAPDDDVPALSRDDVAQRTALMAVAMAELGPRIVTFVPGKAKEVGVYPYTFPPGAAVQGGVTLEFFSGGSGGTHVAYDQADYGELYTAPGEPLHAEIPLGSDATAVFDVTLDLSGSIDQQNSSAVVSGSGSFSSGPWPGTFTFFGLHVAASSVYPTSGNLNFSGGAWTLSAAYDGSGTAVISEMGTDLYVVDLETGTIEYIGD